jgi:hypothetical protein
MTESRQSHLNNHHLCLSVDNQCPLDHFNSHAQTLHTIEDPPFTSNYIHYRNAIALTESTERDQEREQLSCTHVFAADGPLRRTNVVSSILILANICIRSHDNVSKFELEPVRRDQRVQHQAAQSQTRFHRAGIGQYVCHEYAGWE